MTELDGRFLIDQVHLTSNCGLCVDGRRQRGPIVTAGCGWVQREGGPIEEIHPGDVIWFPPGEKHWHGASQTTPMTHIAIHENFDGRVAEWMGKVSDEQYPIFWSTAKGTVMRPYIICHVLSSVDGKIGGAPWTQSRATASTRQRVRS